MIAGVECTPRLVARPVAEAHHLRGDAEAQPAGHLHVARRRAECGAMKSRCRCDRASRPSSVRASSGWRSVSSKRGAHGACVADCQRGRPSFASRPAKSPSSSTCCFSSTRTLRNSLWRSGRSVCGIRTRTRGLPTGPGRCPCTSAARRSGGARNRARRAPGRRARQSAPLRICRSCPTARGWRAPRPGRPASRRADAGRHAAHRAQHAPAHPAGGGPGRHPAGPNQRPT